MARKPSEHKAKAKTLGGFWRQGNPSIRRILTKSSRATIDMFAHPQLLLTGCMNYFNWVDNSPLYEEMVDFYKGGHYSTDRARLRAYTIEGLCAFVGVSYQRWRNALTEQTKVDPDVLSIIEWATNVIYEQTFTGAASGLLKEAIVMRKLGLADKQEKTGADGGPITTEVDVKQGAAEFTAIMLKMAERNSTP